MLIAVVVGECIVIIVTTYQEGGIKKKIIFDLLSVLRRGKCIYALPP